MAIYRNVHISFWTDNKVTDDFTPEDKYFYLYLLTNPHTNLCGCYEVSLKQFSNETGYNKDTIEQLLDRFENLHHVIRYSKETKEVLLLNWGKYNWTKSKNLVSGIVEQKKYIKNVEFTAFIDDLLKSIDTIYIPSTEGMPTSDTDTDTDTVSVIKDIISYLNNKCNTNYKSNTQKTHDLIVARLNEGFAYDDFVKVIDTKYLEWHDDEKMSQYLRPITLFSNKFESYLNQKPVSTRMKSKYSAIEEFLEEV